MELKEDPSTMVSATPLDQVQLVRLTHLKCYSNHESKLLTVMHMLLILIRSLFEFVSSQNAPLHIHLAQKTKPSTTITPLFLLNTSQSIIHLMHTPTPNTKRITNQPTNE
eukprot:m.80475 g.80475  ORF g.80475 m.80475 type:complete len:110 (+) comp8621_c0_seq5:279-608(+)